MLLVTTRGFLGLYTSVDLFGNLLEGPLSDAVSVSAALVVDWLILIVSKEFKGRETLNIVWTTYALIFGHINCAEMHDSLEVFGCQLPRWSQAFAVAAPGRVELNHPEGVLIVEHQFFEVALSELDYWAAVAVKATRKVGEGKTRGNNK